MVKKSDATKQAKENSVKKNAKTSSAKSTKSSTEGKKHKVKSKAAQLGIKRPRTSYILFSTQTRQAIIADNPSLASNVGEIAKKLGEKWANLSNKEKETYNKLAAEDKIRYEKELQQAMSAL